MMVEVYNETTKLDPYHELTHAVAETLGNPPALFNEGLAVFSTEHFAGNAMASFEAPGISVDEAVRRNIDKGEYVGIRELFAFDEIGSAKSHALISYPEAGSFIGWLAAEFREGRLREAYAALKSSTDRLEIERNERVFRRIFGLTPEEGEAKWLRSIGRPEPRGGPR